MIIFLCKIEDRGSKMDTSNNRIILVSGATGNQGGAVTKSLLKNGWRVRALTRTATSDKADKLRASGAEVVEGDMGKPKTIEKFFEDVYGVFSVQNFMTDGIESEIIQGKNMADLAHKSKVSHFVYGSAGEPFGRNTGIPATVYSPGPFMELMTEKSFVPAVGTWGVMDKVVGRSIRVPWIAVDDIGAIVARLFEGGDKFKGETFSLITDQKSLGECRKIYKRITGKNPLRIPMPVWFFKRVVSSELVEMWNWMIDYYDDRDVSDEIQSTRQIYPEASTVESWLTKKLS